MLLVEIITASLVTHAALVTVAVQSQSSESPLQSAFDGLPVTQEFATTIAVPIAVRGSVMLLPLVRRSTEVAWPASMDLRLGDGRRVTGRVAKIESRDLEQLSWASPQRITATTQARGDQDIVLLVPLPTDSDDEMSLGGQKIAPIWMNGLATPIVAGRSELSLNLSLNLSLKADELPDPAAPSEYFRAVLRSYRMGILPPPPEGGEIDVLYARAIAGLWSAAIARLEENDSVTSNRVLGDLVGRAHGLINDSEVTMAAWNTDDDELDALLRSLLTPNVDGIVLAESAKLWLESRSPLLCWLEHDEGESVLIGVANPRAESHALSFRWPDQKDPTLSAEIGPESFQTFSISRARAREVDAVVIDESLLIALQEHGLSSLLPPANLAGPSLGRQAIEAQVRAQPTLIVEHGANTIAMQVGFGRAAVQPPGLGLGMFLPVANLSGIRAGVLKPPPLEWSTSAGIRRRPFGWELLVECRSPPGASPSGDQITVVVGGESAHTITVRSDGQIETNDPVVREALAVHRSKDRWRVRLPLPEGWVTPANGRPGRLEISIARVIDGVGSDAPALFARRQFAGLAPLGINPIAKGIPLDLSSWSLSSVRLAP